MALEHDGLLTMLMRVNRARLGLARDDEAVEDVIEMLFRPSEKLAIYGTLAPGEANHHQIAGLGGRWTEATLQGVLDRVGQGEHQGLPALRLDPKGQAVSARLLESPRLPGAWDRLDAFESREMQRLLAPVQHNGRLLAVANVYTLTSAMKVVLA
ncbi:gamma-glutamylcyclotransferase [Pelagibius sp.]|uniref:gamma-glutamylcyclotransferase n=1 Tax=Pelagibius sp. TaxID=1931238 RepID=UPI003B5104B9